MAKVYIKKLGLLCLAFFLLLGLNACSEECSCDKNAKKIKENAKEIEHLKSWIGHLYKCKKDKDDCD